MNPPPYKTQKQISIELKVSQSALSLTLKDPTTSRVSAHTRQRILDYVKERAPHLYPSKAMLEVCLCLPKIESYAAQFYNDLTKGIVEACDQFGWCTTKFFDYECTTREKIIGKKPPDGIIAVDLSANVVRELREFTSVVLVANRLEGSGCDSIDLDNRGGIRKLIATLAKAGYKRVVFVHGHPREVVLRHHLLERIESVFGSCLAKGIPMSDRDFINITDYGEIDSLEAYQELILRLKKDYFEPVAVVAFNDYIATRFKQMAEMMGFCISKDFGLVGYDNHSSSRLGITSISHDYFAMGRSAAELLSQRMNNPRSHRVILSEPSQLILRESHLLKPVEKALSNRV